VNVPYLQTRLPNTLKWRVLGALMKINQRPFAYTESTRRSILGALGAMNLAAATECVRAARQSWRICWQRWSQTSRRSPAGFYEHHAAPTTCEGIITTR